MSEKSTITEIEDKPGVVYLVGVPSCAPESVREWYFSQFEEMWADRFDHAGVMTVPEPTEGLEVVEADKEELKEMLEDE